MSAGELVFVKLGGSLITDKTRPGVAREEVIARLARELMRARLERPDLRLLIGHGSGSFGHVVGQRYGTRAGVRDAEGWRGFAETAAAAARLNRIVTDQMLAAGLPVWSIQPSATARCRDGRLVSLGWEAIQRALDVGLVPLIYGDVALDEVRGGTIVSTEELFAFLAPILHPRRIVLVGEVDGVFTTDPRRDPAARRIPRLTPEEVACHRIGLGEAHGVDVTGGMASKVRIMADLVRQMSDLDVHLIGGLAPDALFQVLMDPTYPAGTHIRHQA
ncbi:MAG TPA: isopentenyl phosphate kinase family protein [Caldilineae bacterium]|nr:isopentenyl phosphate kinase family protein [Caldilineae bacterium]